MRRVLIPLALGGILALAGCDGATDDSGTGENAAINDSAATEGENAALGDDTQAFLNQAMEADNAEVVIGQLATKQGGSAAVKNYGAMLAADHGAHKGKLGALATAAGIAPADGIGAAGQASLDKLKGLSGAQFDQAFKQSMIADHEKNIAEYQRMTAAPDRELANLARETLPVLRKHLEAARRL